MVFYARPVDDDAKPKSKADFESQRAVWISYEDLKKDIEKKKKKMRSYEPLAYFKMVFDDYFKRETETMDVLKHRLEFLYGTYGCFAVESVLAWAADRAEAMGPNEFEWVASMLRETIKHGVTE